MEQGVNNVPPEGPVKDARLMQPNDGIRVYGRRSTGAFVSPAENTWAAHDQLIRRAPQELGFNPDRYAYFDGKVAEKFANPALTNPKHADYARFEAMRGNIAVLRNFILTHYEETGVFKNGSYVQRPRLEAIAEALGQALANDKWGTRAFTKSTNVDIANIDGVGAAEMYKHLLEIQETPTIRPAMIAQLKQFLALPNRDFGLPPLSASPFSPQALAAPPPGFIGTPLPKTDTSSDTYSDAQSREEETQNGDAQPRPVELMASTSPEAVNRYKDEIDEAIAMAEQAVKTANALQSIETLAEAPREESVEEARKILRALRNMEFTERPMEEFLEQGSAAVIASKKQSFSHLIDIFSTHLRHAQSTNPNIASTNPAVQQARDTLYTIALELAEHTRKLLRAEDEREERLNQLIDSIPHEADIRIIEPVSRILDTVELGLEHASGREVNTTTLERLLLASERLEKHTVLLEHPEQDAPSREESIAMARKALAQMAELPMGDQSLLDFIENGSPKEQAAFAQQVEELVSIYRNIIIEATQSNGEVILDPKVKEANDAIGGFAHAVKLMAAKEMPNSIASAQQISAEQAQDPQKWKDLSHHAVNRLIKSAEGGLEKAIGEISSDAEEQEEDIATELINEALNNVDSSKRKKKRRRGNSSSRSGKGARKMKKKVMDMTADDYVLKQGRFAEESKEMRRETGGVNFNASRAAQNNTRQQNNSLDQEASNRARGVGRFDETGPATTQRGVHAQNSTANTQTNRNPTRGNGQVRPPSANRPISGLKESDLAAIAKLGGSLRDIGSQLQSISVSTVSGVDKTMPDARKQQPQEQRDTSHRNNGPGIR